MPVPKKSSGQPRAYKRIDRIDFPGREKRVQRVNTALKREVSEIIRKRNLVDIVMVHYLRIGHNTRDLRRGLPESEVALRHEIDSALFGALLRDPKNIFPLVQASFADISLGQLIRDISMQRFLPRQKIEKRWGAVEELAKIMKIDFDRDAAAWEALMVQATESTYGVQFSTDLSRRMNVFLNHVKLKVVNDQGLKKLLGFIDYRRYILGREILYLSVMKKLRRMKD